MTLTVRYAGGIPATPEESDIIMLARVSSDPLLTIAYAHMDEQQRAARERSLITLARRARRGSHGHKRG